MNETITVHILGPNTEPWSGEAESVSSENKDGPFDILPQHANFLTLIENAPIIIRMKGKEEVRTYKTAVLYAYENAVSIYIPEEESVEKSS